jgi:23S rRNA pseudouridine2605 synthase
LPTQPIVKLLTAAGLGSRRKMTDAIKRGIVRVNGRVIEGFTAPVDPDHDKITVDGRPVSASNVTNTYLLMNKPRGLVSTTRDDRGARTVLDILPEKYRGIRLYPVGRLDKESTGLVLLTNDGDLTLRLTHPRYENEKEYLVRIAEELTLDDLSRFASGIDLDDGRTSPARVKKIAHPSFNYSVVIHEGKKHQVRRMFAALGYTVLALKRVRLGPLRLGTLPEGQVRELTPAELASMKKPD